MIQMFSGAMVGLLMATIFITAGMMTLFYVIKDPPPIARPVLARFPPGGLALAIVAASYPAWAAIGGLLGLLYQLSVSRAPGPGMGSPNLFYTFVIVALTVMAAAPFVFLLRGRPLAGVAVIALSFLGIFGWFFPYFAA